MMQEGGGKLFSFLPNTRKNESHVGVEQDEYVNLAGKCFEF